MYCDLKYLEEHVLVAACLHYPWGQRDSKLCLLQRFTLWVLAFSILCGQGAWVALAKLPPRVAQLYGCESSVTCSPSASVSSFQV